MTEDVREIATKLLDFFGLDGKRWTQGTLYRIGNHRGEPEPSYCLFGACDYLGINRNDLNKKLVTDLPQWVSIPNFNDKNDWPTVREWLSKLAHPYQPKE
jgi:hypothetical protein